MALGKPMIVGKGTLVAERVAMIGNGVTISYGSKEELKNVVLDLKSNPAFVKEMGEKGKEEFRERWSPVGMERRLLGAYRRLAP
jgi:glycosyltransferase involved in cell wall biosynthesis